MEKKVYIHKKTGNEYLLISTKHRFKYNGVWHDAYLYQPRYSNEYEYFSKTPEEFNEEFVEANWADYAFVPVEPEKMKDWTKVKSPLWGTELFKECSTYQIQGLYIRNTALCCGDLNRPNIFMGEYAYCDFDPDETYLVTVDKDNTAVDICE